MKKVIMVTGGAGFIGTNLVEYMCSTYKTYCIICYDALTYAANRIKVNDFITKYENFIFVKGDITNKRKVMETLEKYEVTDIIHLAAESHVDRSISNPYIFEETNVKGTLVLLDCALDYWQKKFGTLNGHRFHHVSTDEVYGSLELDSEDRFDESCQYSPNSPYSASKAASDHFVNAYHTTYGLETTITNCSNNYGRYQHEEKFMPTVIKSIILGRNIPVYGDGKNVRDWLYVLDHVKAICSVFHDGKLGETYCVGGVGEKDNLTVIDDIMKTYVRYMKITKNADVDINELRNLITFVEDRKGHDKRYAICHNKIAANCNWVPNVSWWEGLWNTIDYYVTGGENPFKAEKWLNQ